MRDKIIEMLFCEHDISEPKAVLIADEILHMQRQELSKVIGQGGGGAGPYCSCKPCTDKRKQERLLEGAGDPCLSSRGLGAGGRSASEPKE